MTKKQAIRALNRQRETLQTPDVLYGYVWANQTYDYLVEIFGTKSSKSVSMQNFNPVVQGVVAYGQHTGYEDSKKYLDQLLVDSIESVSHGAFIKDKNFLSRISEGWLIVICTFGLPSLLAIGTLWGKNLSDTQNIELRRNNKILQDSLSAFRTSPPQLIDRKTESKTNDSTSAK